MVLEALNLINFRNFERLELEFSQTSVIVGQNSVGKTNVLESIYFLSSGKSLKGDYESEMILFGKHFSRIEGEVDNVGKLEIRLALVNGRFKKELLINGVRKRLLDFIGNFYVVIFTPTDLNLVTDSPALRRDHLNVLLSQADYTYRKVILSYEKALKSRNKVLLAISQGRSVKDQLSIWDEILTKLGNLIIRKRHDLFLFLNNYKSNFGNFQWHYLPNLITIGRLKACLVKDLETASTNIGPHRDEFRFLLGKNDLGLFGSRGEQRLSVLALKLAELEFLKTKITTQPILLLDDAFSELDSYHRNEVIKILDNQQTILTTTSLSDLKLKDVKGIKIIEL